MQGKEQLRAICLMLPKIVCGTFMPLGIFFHLVLLSVLQVCDSQAENASLLCLISFLDLRAYKALRCPKILLHR